MRRADLFSVDPGGGSLRNLTKTPRTWEVQVSASPDGSQLAFVRGARAGRGGWLVVADSDAASPTDLGPAAPGPEPTAPPAWSPDGRRVAFTNAVGCDEVVCKTWEVWVADVAARRRRRITARGMSPSWSPDGRRIAYAGNLVTAFTAKGYFTFSTDVVVENLRTGATRTLGRGARPVWSVRGDWIAFVAPGGRLRLVRSDGSDGRTVGSGAAGSSWTRDGRLVFLLGRPDSDVTRVVAYVPARGVRSERALTRDEYGGVALGPGGHRLAWARFAYSRSEAASHDDLVVGPVGERGSRVVVEGDPGSRIGAISWASRDRIVFSAARVG